MYLILFFYLFHSTPPNPPTTNHQPATSQAPPAPDSTAAAGPKWPSIALGFATFASPATAAEGPPMCFWAENMSKVAETCQKHY